MARTLKDEVDQLLRLGLFPAMVKPTARYRVTYQDGSKEFIYTRYTLKTE